MLQPEVDPLAQDAAYWRRRVHAETRAALASRDPKVAAIHVELATRCLRMILGGKAGA